MSRAKILIFLWLLGAVPLGLTACSTGTVDRGLFAHTQDETYARVRAAVPIGTPLAVAQATMQSLGWSCYIAARSWVVPNDTNRRIDGPTLTCDAYPSIGGYPFSKEYDATFLIQSEAVGPLQVILTHPTV